MSNDPLSRVMWELRIRHDTNDTFINIYIGAEKARLTQYYVNKKATKPRGCRRERDVLF